MIKCDKCGEEATPIKLYGVHHTCTDQEVPGVFREFAEIPRAPKQTVKVLMPGWIQCTTCFRKWEMSREDIDRAKYGCEHGKGDFTCHDCRKMKSSFQKLAEDIDVINHPSHYNSHPSGVECITIIEHLPYNIGAAIKYLWRHGQKGPALEDLKKAAWHINREIGRLEKTPAALQSVGSTQCKSCFKIFPGGGMPGGDLCSKCLDEVVVKGEAGRGLDF